MPRSKAIPRLPTGRPPKYDWPVLLNGTPRVLRPGEDFDTSAQGFRAQVYAAAVRIGRSATTRVRPDGSLFVQGGPRRYDFDFSTLFDGAEHVLFHETHFVGAPATFADAIRAAARKAGVSVGVQAFADRRIVVVRPGPAQRVSRYVNRETVSPAPVQDAPWRPKRGEADEGPSPHQPDCTCPWRRGRRRGVDRACPRHGLASATIAEHES